MFSDLRENCIYWTIQPIYVWGELVTKLSQLILVTTTLLGSVSTITVGNFVHFRSALTYMTLRPCANFSICQRYERLSVLDESQMKNRKSVDRPAFKKTSSCSSAPFSEKKTEDVPGGTCDPRKD